MNDQEFAQLKKRIASLLDLDLDCYKPTQMRRRIGAFVRHSGAATPAVFTKRLQQDAGLLEELRDMLTINVTEFFRDAAQWKRLRETVLPKLAKDQLGLRIWSAGCSNGGEPYSVAMLLDDLGIRAREPILATDIDRRILQRAEAGGPYLKNDVRQVPESLRRKYLTEEDGGYFVARSVRRKVQFKVLNLLTDRFETNFDLILCRNVVIYFEDETKRDLFRRFHQSLAPRGILFIGATETMLGSDLVGFQRVGGNFYQRTPITGRRRAAA